MKKLTPKKRIRTEKKPEYFINQSKLKRYDQRNLIFNRVFMDPSFPSYKQTEEKQGLKNIIENLKGYTRIDYALAEASWTVHDTWEGAFKWERLERLYGPSLMGDKWYSKRHDLKDTKEATQHLKRAAQFFGAALVGICHVNELWIYANDRRTLKPISLPREINQAVVMAVEMDEIGIATSPEAPSAAATGLGYSKMAFLAQSLAEFIRNLGYMALPAGNDTALSVPLAIDAGLGQLGRNGLLITPEYGPRVRLCKVFTDLPLENDKPIDFGVTEFCRNCQLCAEACKADAISQQPEPTWKTSCKSNNPGSLKWYVNGEKCYNFWCENGIDCSTCISICPFNNGRNKATTEKFWKSHPPQRRN
jgi:hypothetical protein